MSEPVEQQGWRARAASMFSLRPREMLALAILVVVVVAGAIFAFVRTLPHPQPLGTPAAGLSVAASPSITAPASISQSPGGKIFVQVAGAVWHPGVYEFENGARVIDAVHAAGGATKNGDPSSINLARRLTDGERVYVPKIGEQPPADTQASGSVAGGGGKKGKSLSGAKVNINTASSNELQSLPGIGPSLAQRIVDYRTQHGPFHSVEDLRKVPGIGPKKFDSLKDYVTV